MPNSIFRKLTALGSTRSIPQSDKARPVKGSGTTFDRLSAKLAPHGLHISTNPSWYTINHENGQGVRGDCFDTLADISYWIKHDLKDYLRRKELEKTIQDLHDQNNWYGYNEARQKEFDAAQLEFTLLVGHPFKPEYNTAQ